MWKNSIKTALIMAILAGMMMFVGGLFGGTTGLTYAFIMAIIMNSIMYFWSDSIVLKLYHAKEISPHQYPAIRATVQELCHTMRLPMPRLWIIKSPVANAFATGRNPYHSSVAFTTGILDLLDEQELRGVIAHELSHILHRDILVSTIAATFATAIGYMANTLQHIILFGSRRERSSHSNALGLFITALCMPLIATLMRLSISRSREYLADEQGAKACHDPLALASALQKLHMHTQEASFTQHSAMHQATAGLFIVHPFASGNILELFSTHPPLKKRICALQTIHHTMHQRPR